MDSGVEITSSLEAMVSRELSLLFLDNLDVYKLTLIASSTVNGGKVLGDFPTPLSPDNDQWIGRGRFIPTTPWDSMVSGYFIHAGIGKW